MLGLRRLNGVQVDLFQGDLTDFVADMIAIAADSQQAVSGNFFGPIDQRLHKKAGATLAAEFQSALKNTHGAKAVVTGSGKLPASFILHELGGSDPLDVRYNQILLAAQNKGVRHIAISRLLEGNVPSSVDAESAMDALKRFILASKNEARNLQRITLVLEDGAEHEMFQTALFSKFEEG